MKTTPWVTRAISRYVLALVPVLVAFGLTTVTWPLLRPTPIAIYFAAVTAASWYFGRGPGLLATGVSCLFVHYYFFVESAGTTWWNLPSHPGTTIFVAVALLITSLVTARQRAETALKETHQRTLAILESITDAFYALDGRWRFTYVNAHCQEVMGRTAEELLGRPLYEVFPELTGSMYAERFEAVLREQKPTHFEARGPLVDRWFEIHAYPTADGLSVYFRDITERKETAEKLQEADRRKDEFLAMLGHELRNPLAAISNAVQLAQLSSDPGNQAWTREIVIRQVKHLARMVDDLLDVSRITQGKIQLNRQLVDVAAVVQGAAEVAGPIIKSHGHSLVVSCPEGPLRLEADPVRLEQVVVNLLNNAARYTEPGGRIWLTVERSGGEVRIRVRDTGAGIAPEDIPRMFEMFVQGERSISRLEGGLGIGLTLVRRIVELHGGSVEARSGGPGQGSEFTVRLAAAREGTETEGLAVAPTTEVPMGRCRILVVEDNPDTARGLGRLLELLGHEVRLAYDGLEGVAEAIRFVPDYVLLDIGLPGIDGYEVARRLRREPALGASVIVAVSGYAQDEDRRRSREAGMDHHLAKPVAHDELLRLIHAGHPCAGG